jgi:hypothetical protein
MMHRMWEQVGLASLACESCDLPKFGDGVLFVGGVLPPQTTDEVLSSFNLVTKNERLDRGM